MTGISRRLASRIAMCSTGIQDEYPHQATHACCGCPTVSSELTFPSHLPKLFLGMALMSRVGEGRFHFFHFVDAATDRLKIGEHAAQPSLVDENLIGALGFFFQNLRCLALGADE